VAATLDCLNGGRLAQAVIGVLVHSHPWTKEHRAKKDWRDLIPITRDFDAINPEGFVDQIGIETGGEKPDLKVAAKIIRTR
jgi:hypothetical protein